MNQYLLSMYQPDGDLPRPDEPLTPDGRTLISGGHDQTVREWSVPDPP